MKRTFLTKIAVSIGALMLGLAAAGSASAQDPSHHFGVRCLSNGMETTMASTLPGSFYAVYVQKFLPPNWVGIGYATSWIGTDDYASTYQNPVGAPITFRSRTSFRLEPGSYFAWALFASRNAQGGFSYEWVRADQGCTIQGSVFAKAGKGNRQHAKPAHLPRNAPTGAVVKR